MIRAGWSQCRSHNHSRSAGRRPAATERLAMLNAMAQMCLFVAVLGDKLVHLARQGKGELSGAYYRVRVVMKVLGCA